MNETNRINFINLVLGRRGSGKTTFMRQLIKSLNYTKDDMKILIVDTFDNPAYRDVPIMKPSQLKAWKNKSIYRMFGSDTENILAEIQKYSYNTLIIFEDAVKYINKNLQKDVRKFIIDSKQKNLDLIFLFHGFASTPPELFRLSDTVTMFRCDNPEYRKSEIIEYDLILEAWQKIYKSNNPYDKETIRLQ